MNEFSQPLLTIISLPLLSNLFKYIVLLVLSNPKTRSLYLLLLSLLPFAEAGGIAADASGNHLDFSKGRYLDLDTGIIVANKKLMPALLNAVQESIKAQSASHL